MKATTRREILRSKESFLKLVHDKRKSKSKSGRKKKEEAKVVEFKAPTVKTLDDLVPMYSIQEVADKLDKSYSTIWRAINRKKLMATMVDGEWQMTAQWVSDYRYKFIWKGKQVNG